MKLTVIAVFGVLSAIGTGVWMSESEVDASAGTIGTVFTVARDELVVTLTENGTLVAKDSKRIKPETDGEAKITWLIEEGSSVKEGDEIAKLDAERLEQAIEQLEIDIGQAETAANMATTELEIQETDNITNTEKAEMDLERAEKELERYRDGDSKQARRDLTIKIKDMETALSRAKKRLQDSTLLVEQKFIKKTELEDHQLEFEKATVQRDGANLDLELFDKYTFPMTMAEKEVALRKAKRDLDTSQKRAGSKLAQRQGLVAQSGKKLKKLRKRLKDKREKLGKMTLTAPVPGIVFYGDPREPWRRNEIRIGASVWRGHTLITIPDLRVMQVKVKVHEADVEKVAVGQKVAITMDTYPGRVFEAEVTKVAPIASTRDRWGGNTEVKVFDVETTLADGEQLDVKPGISAKVKIFIDRKPDVLFVPLQSVGIDGEKHFCHVVSSSGGEPQRRTVEVGLSSDTYIEIIDGLEADEKVLLYNPMLPLPPSDSEEESEEGAGDGPAMPTSGDAQ